MPPFLNWDHVEALRVTSRELRGFLCLDPEMVYIAIVSAMRKLFRVEYAALFLQRHNDKGFVVLAAAEPKKPTSVLRLPISKAERAGLTGFFATLNRVEAYDFTSIKNLPSWGVSNPVHLPSLACHSVLAIPIRDRKAFLTGLLKLENKLGPDCNPGPDFQFGPVDKAMAEILTQDIAAILESSLRRHTLLNLSDQLATCSDASTALKEVLEASLALLTADRADLSFLDETAHKFVIAEQAGAPAKLARLGDGVPAKGVVYSLWESGELHKLAKSVWPGQPGYLAVHPDVRSELAIVCRVNGRNRAVLNVESFQENWFDEQDVPVLRLLEPLAARGILLSFPRSQGEVQSSGGLGWPADPPGVAWLVVTRRRDRGGDHPAHERLYASISPSFHKVFGVKATATKETYFAHLLDREMAQRLEGAIVRAVLENDRKIERLSGTEVEFRLASEGTRTIQMFFQLTAPGTVLCTVRDVTELRGAHDRKEEFLPRLPVICSRLDGTYEYVSPVAAQIYGYGSAEEFSTKITNARQLYGDPGRREDLLRLLDAEPLVVGFEFMAMRWDSILQKQVPIWLSQTVERIGPNREKAKWRLLAYLYDITDRKALEQKLCLAGVTGVLLHDTRGPLQRILTNTGVIRNLIERGSYYRDQMEGLVDDIERDCRTYDAQCIAWMKMARGETKCELKVQDLVWNLKEFILTAQHYSKLSIEFNPAMQKCFIAYNASYLDIAFRQIFRNCDSCMQDPKKCRVTLREEDGFAQILIDDFGPGFRKDDLGSGWRAIAALHRPAENRGGFGLVMCNAVVEIHNGEMSLSNWKTNSGALGGARVRLRFPLPQTST